MIQREWHSRMEQWREPVWLSCHRKTQMQLLAEAVEIHLLHFPPRSTSPQRQPWII